MIRWENDEGVGSFVLNGECLDPRGVASRLSWGNCGCGGVIGSARVVGVEVEEEGMVQMLRRDMATAARRDVTSTAGGRESKRMGEEGRGRVEKR